MAENDIVALKELASGGFLEVALAPADIGAATTESTVAKAKALADEYTGNPALIYTSESGIGWHTLADPASFRTALELSTNGNAAGLYDNIAGQVGAVVNDFSFRINGDGVSADFDTANLTASRAYGLPDASGTIARTEDFASPPAIGSTTPAAGSFTTLAANNGTLTASAPVLDLAQTWNNAAVAFTGVNIAITESALAAGSRFFDVKTGATSIFSLRNFNGNGAAEVLGIQGPSRGFIFGPQTTNTASGFFSLRWQFNVAGLARDAIFAWGTDVYGLVYDLAIQRDAADTLAQRRGTNPQTFRIYNTFTDASNHERGFMRWSSNVLQIGTEKGGTGSARALELSVDGTTRLTISAATGNTSITSGNSLIFTSCGRLVPTGTDGVMSLVDFANSGWNRLNFGGTTSSFPALKRSSTTLQVRLANDSDFAPLSCGALTLNGNLDASTRDLVTDTTTGTKIGTGTTQKIGFFNATPVVQQAAVADATDAASTQARLNDLLARLRTLGLIAT